MNRSRLSRWAVLLFGAAVILAIAPQGRAQAQTSQRCFAETGFCIEGRIREFWEQNGGLPVFGFPVGPQQLETIENRQLQVQWFERNRLELHPENARPYDVLLGRLGADRLAQQGRDPFTFPKTSAQPGCRFFAETGHNVCGDILKAWRASGLEFDGKKGKSEAENLALFGLPLSDPQVETLGDGKQYTAQWFERARFELHPENQPPYTVLLGLLGNEIRANTAAPAPTPAPNPCADVPEPKNARIRPGKCVKQGEVIAMDIYGFQPNEQIGFWLTAPNGAVLGTVHTYNVGPNGAVEGLPFDTKDLDPGLWFWVFKSSTSDYASVIYFKVLKP
ncbi:MAG TPA: hypothetical protein PKK15_15395 [Kouleothrix sp.]|uniref:hypothetical protein n=1 Tax=Kouleothrix sp. TaxID=2779161 RepID=UPI002C1B7BF2|nr:hypothetical protein [Kouleothrix sp.]